MRRVAFLSTWGPLAALALGCACIVWLEVQLAGDFRADDAYITYTFSKSLATGQGPTYPLGARAEGYSNFLWMILHAAVLWLQPAADPMRISRGISYLALVGLGIFSYRLARLHAGRVASALFLLLLFAWSDLTRAAQSGMETALYAAFIVWGVGAYLREDPERRRASLVPFVLAALTRIDGMVPLAIVGAHAAAESLRRRPPLRGFLVWISPLAVYVVYFTWRFSYYGLPFPLTYYAKSLATLAEPDRGFQYAWTALRDLGALALVPLAAPYFVRHFGRSAVFLLWFSGAWIAYVIHVGGDWMPFNRFWIPLAPVLGVSAAWGVTELWEGARKASERGAVVVVAAGCAAFLGVHLDSHWAVTPPEEGKLGAAAGLARHTNEQLLAHRRWIQAIVRRPGDVLVTDYGGVFAYYTEGARIIEMWGLCNREIALLGDTRGINPIYGKTCVECYRDFNPDYFHVVVPLERDLAAFRTQWQVIRNVFQGPALDTVLDLRNAFATGRVVSPSTRTALYFLERRRPDLPLVPREAGEFIIDYPFEPGGVHPAFR